MSEEKTVFDLLEDQLEQQVEYLFDKYYRNKRTAEGYVRGREPAGVFLKATLHTPDNESRRYIFAEMFVERQLGYYKDEWCYEFKEMFVEWLLDCWLNTLEGQRNELRTQLEEYVREKCNAGLLLLTTTSLKELEDECQSLKNEKKVRNEIKSQLY